MCFFIPNQISLWIKQTELKMGLSTSGMPASYSLQHLLVAYTVQQMAYMVQQVCSLVLC